MTNYELLLNHFGLWQWCSDNPDKFKTDCPIWKELDWGLLEHHEKLLLKNTHCFLCLISYRLKKEILLKSIICFSCSIYKPYDNPDSDYHCSYYDKYLNYFDEAARLLAEAESCLKRAFEIPDPDGYQPHYLDIRNDLLRIREDTLKEVTKYALLIKNLTKE